MVGCPMNNRDPELKGVRNSGVCMIARCLQLRGVYDNRGSKWKGVGNGGVFYE